MTMNPPIYDDVTSSLRHRLLLLVVISLAVTLQHAKTGEAGLALSLCTIYININILLHRNK